MSFNRDPNFPPDLDIHPLASSSSDSDVRFDSAAQQDAIKTYGIAGRIWEASHAMLAYLDPNSPLEFDPPPPAFAAYGSTHPVTAIELGSGTGFLAARVAEWLRPDRDLLIATDLPEVCPMLETNLDSCRPTRVRPLPWGSSKHARAIYEELYPLNDCQCSRHLTHIICSDLIYFPALLAPLLRSLLHLTSPPFVDGTHPEPATVILSYKIRSLAKETPFWNAFGLWFEFVPVLARRRERAGKVTPSTGGLVQEQETWSRFSPGDDTDETFVFAARRRRESLRWTVPEQDSALIAGIGAHGTDAPKSDEQFEQFLLMGMEV